MNARSYLVLAPALTLAAACASGGASGGGGSGGGGAATGPTPSTSTQIQPAVTARWPVKTREHVDLWLHGFAMLSDDTTLVPLFRRGYTDQMIVLKNHGNVVTQLDANRDKLRARLLANPQMVNAQFMPLAFQSWDEMSQAITYFLKADGDPNRAQTRELAAQIATIAAYFQTQPDREWLRLFVQSLQDESTKYYHSYWLQAQRQRENVVTVVDSLWEKTYRPRLQTYLNNSGQTNGEILLSLPLGGEGRSQSNSKLQNIITVTFPDTPAQADEAIYVIAHEAIASIANSAVADNTTPNDKRNGVSDRYTSAAAVRGGAMLIQRIAPELLPGYARYYLGLAKRPVGADPMTALAAGFPLPDAIRDALGRQLNVVLGGI
jgi:hypothetical protein